MTIKADPTQPTTRWLVNALSACGIAFGLIEHNPQKVLSAAKSAISTKISTEYSIPQLAWLIWERTVQISTLDWVIENELFSDNAESVEEAVNRFLDLDRERPYTIDNDYLTLPFKIPNLVSLERFLRHNYETTDKQTTDFARIFIYRWNEQLYSNFDLFEPLIRALTVEAKLGGDRNYKWNRYHDWLRREFEDKPLFGQPKNGLTLAQIYTPLRCISSVVSKSKDPASLSKTIYINDLYKVLVDWLRNSDKYDDLRVITGGPGSGKSSTAKALAANLAKERIINVFFVPMQGIDISQDVSDIIEQYIQIARSNDDIFETNPLNDIRVDQNPVLIIFDGLDEVKQSLSAKRDDETTKFLQKLRSFLRRTNETLSRFTVKAVVLGRPAAAEEAAYANDLPRERLLKVAPLCPIEIDQERDCRIEVVDPQSLMKLDQRPRFLEKYAYATGVEIDTKIFLDDERFQEITREPLLLYLFAFSDILKDHVSIEHITRNDIYYRIFEKLHERDAIEKVSDLKSEIKLDDFFVLMECLGAAAWVAGGRVGSTEDFERLRDKVYAARYRDKFSRISAATLKNVALQFYTQPTGDNEVGYEFIHKSFGEYLAARAILSHAKQCSETLAVSGDLDAVAISWMNLVGRQGVSAEIIRWMRDEINFRYPCPLNEADVIECREICRNLCKLVGFAVKDHFPAHKIGLDGFDECLMYANNALASLLICLNAFAHTAFPEKYFEKKSRLGWAAGPLKIDGISPLYKHSDDASDTQVYLYSQIDKFRQSWNATIFYSVATPLDYIDFSKCFFDHGQFFSVSLRYCNFEECNLSFAQFTNADLTHASFSKSDLRKASFERCIFEGTVLDNASLHGASLLPLHTMQRASAYPKTLPVAQEEDIGPVHRSLTPKQISRAQIDELTRLPKHLR